MQSGLLQRRIAWHRIQPASLAARARHSDDGVLSAGPRRAGAASRADEAWPAARRERGTDRVGLVHPRARCGCNSEVGGPEAHRGQFQRRTTDPHRRGADTDRPCISAATLAAIIGDALGAAYALVVPASWIDIPDRGDDGECRALGASAERLSPSCTEDEAR